MTQLTSLFDKVKQRISEQIVLRATTAMKDSKRLSLIWGGVSAVALYIHIFHIPKDANYLQDSFYSFLYLASISAVVITGMMPVIGLWAYGLWKQIRDIALALDFNIIHGTRLSGSVDKTCQKLLPEENAQLFNSPIKDHEMQFLYNKIHERGFIIYDDLVELQHMMNLSQKQLSEQQLMHAYSFLEENKLTTQQVPGLLENNYKAYHVRSFKGKL